jgi:hypothetical protein
MILTNRQSAAASGLPTVMLSFIMDNAVFR